MWDHLKNTEKPIVLYGTGNGAEKIAAVLKERGIRISGVFASDDFVRSKTFEGLPVTNYGTAKESFGDMIILVCFGTDRPELIKHIAELSEEQELYCPDVPVFGGGLFDKEYKEAHDGELSFVRSRLADEQSRRVFDSVIEYKLCGRPKLLFGCESPEIDAWKLLDLKKDESYLDLGAYTGDTISSFIEAAGSYGNIYAFEPDARNFRKLSENTAGLSNCNLYNIAVSDKKETVRFLKNAGRGSSAKGGKEIFIDADSVDNVLKDRTVSVIKFDVEGEEKKAISGAKHVIKRDHPKMMIAAYHRTEDLFAIPMQVLDIDSSYKLYLRHSPCLPAWEINYMFI